MMHSLVHGISANLEYRGGIGHLAFLMQRVSGLATLMFLTLHIVLETSATLAPQVYDRLNAGLANHVVLSAEICMAFFVIYHSVNGFRIACSDLVSSDWWMLHPGPRSFAACWIISLALWTPAAVLMLMHRVR